MPLDAAVNECVATPDSRANPACIRVEQPRWAVLLTYPQAEDWAEQNLRHRGYTTFLPRYNARVRDRTTPTLTRIVERPLFAGYIFCLHNPRDPWRPIRYCPGIRANLIDSPSIQYAREGDVEAVQAAQALTAPRDAPNTPWRVGAIAAPASGYYNGLNGIIVEMRGKRAILAIMLGDRGFLARLSVDVNNLVARE